MKYAVALAATLMLTACVDDPAPGRIPAPGGIIPQSTCGADALQEFIGLPEDILPPVRTDVIRRTIRPGDAMTEDFNLQRLNVYLDESDIITRITCG